MRLVYLLISYLLAPFAVVFLAWKGLGNRAYWDRFGERFGYGKTRVNQPSIWIHAVSVGEVMAASSLIDALRLRYPGIPLVVSTVTPTGAQRLTSLFGDAVLHTYAPYDTPGSVARFFDRIQPRLAIIMETELWPNLYSECGHRGTALVLANARISPRSVAKYRRFVSLFKEALSYGIVIAAQSQRDAERFLWLGASPERTHVMGNIKFDLKLGPDTVEAGRRFREGQVGDRPAWIAASTHDGEEEVVLDAWKKVREAVPDSLLVLVPRHPERFDLVAGLLKRRGIRYVRRSEDGVCGEDTDVYLADTLGELPIFYAASDVAFVGGSLVPVGGHNLLEPATLGLPTITGPYNFNAEDIATLLRRTRALGTVGDAGELADQVTGLLRDPGARERRGARARRAVIDNGGALDRLLELIAPLLRASYGDAATPGREALSK